MIEKLDFIGVPSRDADRSRAFYVETLGLRPDSKSDYEFWVGDTCFEIWDPTQGGAEFVPQPNGIAVVRVDVVDAARCVLEAKGVEFSGETFDSGVCHMATFSDPEGNQLVLHKRYASYTSETPS